MGGVRRKTSFSMYNALAVYKYGEKQTFLFPWPTNIVPTISMHFSTFRGRFWTVLVFNR